MPRHLFKKASGAICVLCVIGIVFAFSKIIPLGMSGSIGQSVPYIILVLGLFILGVPAAVFYQSQRSKPKTDPELEKMRAEMAALAQSGKKK